MSKPKVVIADYGSEYVPESLQLLRDAGFEVVDAAVVSPNDPAATMYDADAIMTVWFPITAEIIAKLQHCKVIIRRGVGVDTVDIDAAAAHGIPVCNVPDYCIAEVADHAFALAVSLARLLPTFDRTLREGNWRTELPYKIHSYDSLVFATASFGRIARAVLKRAAGCEFQVAAYDPYVPDEVFAAAGVRRFASLDEMFEQSDILSLHAPLTPETRHMVNTARLKQMRPSAILVNTSRGPLIDTRALAEALEAREIAAAGLDVFETEPIEPDHPILKSPYALLSQHWAWYSEESTPKLHIMGAETIVRALRGEPLRSCVNGVRE